MWVSATKLMKEERDFERVLPQFATGMTHFSSLPTVATTLDSGEDATSNDSRIPLQIYIHVYRV